jgi:hypothetical protein
MSALGQKQTSRFEIGMSALPPKADIADHDPDVRFVPEADIASSLDQLVSKLQKGFAYREPESSSPF